MKKLLLYATFIILFSSCATIIGGRYTKITIVGNLPEDRRVNVFVDDKEYLYVKLPYRVKVLRNGMSKLAVEYNGTYAQIGSFQTKFNELAILSNVADDVLNANQNCSDYRGFYFPLNIFSFIDAVSGADRKIVNKIIYANF